MKKYIVQIEASIESDISKDYLQSELIIALKDQQTENITIESEEFKVIEYNSLDITPDIDSFLERISLVVIEDGELTSYDWEQSSDSDIVEEYLKGQGHDISKSNRCIKENSDIDLIDETIKATKGELDYLE